MRAAVLALAGALVGAGPGSGQGIGDRIGSVEDGTVRMAFPARDGLCGDGENWSYGRRESRDWGSECEPGPVRVALEMRDGAVNRIRTYVGGRWRGTARLDLGRVSGAEAAAFLLGLVDGPDERAARRALTAVTLAAGVTVWPELLRVARDEARSSRLRKHALSLAAMEAARGIAADDVDDPDRETREQAVFALSQRPRDEAVPRLIELARSHRLPHVRRRALFWLGQTGDARAIPVLEEVLRSRLQR